MTIQANSVGHVAGHFTIPANVRAGTKLVQFLGANGSYGEITFTGQGTLVNQTQRQVANQRFLQWWDPLAQTFSLPIATTITGVDLWFTAKGTSRVMVQIRDTTTGFPNQTILTQVFLLPAQIATTGTTRVTWSPIRLEANHEYALIVGCDDADAALAIAELGKYDSINSKWVTSQPYQIGVMLSSSNASTWTAHQDKDLAFKLLTQTFSATSRTIALPAVAVTNCSEVIVLGQIDRPTSNCDVRFQLTLPDSTVVTVIENQPVTFATAQTGNITWNAILTGTSTASPSLAPDVQLAWGNRATAATYITRAIPAGVACKVSVYYEVLTPGTSSVDAHAQNNATWTAVPVVTGTPIGYNWIAVKRQLTPFSPAGNETRVKLTLNGSGQSRPIVRNLQVIIT
jgi:hypothetical protein